MANQALLTDLELELGEHRLLSIYRARRSQHREVLGHRSITHFDFATVSDRDNLVQAITIRLLTPRGELAALGHPDYGSRLPELIGQQRTDTTRNLAKLYILEALKQERRIAEVIKLTVENHPVKKDPNYRHMILVHLQVRAIGDSAVIDLGPFTLDLGS